jgi:hypothetical protein
VSELVKDLLDKRMATPGAVMIPLNTLLPRRTNVALGVIVPATLFKGVRLSAPEKVTTPLKLLLV